MVRDDCMYSTPIYNQSLEKKYTTYVLYPHHYNSRFVYFKATFWRSKTFFQGVFFQRTMPLCMVGTQKRFVIKSRLWWRAYGIWTSFQSGFQWDSHLLAKRTPNYLHISEVNKKLNPWDYSETTNELPKVFWDNNYNFLKLLYSFFPNVTSE